MKLMPMMSRPDRAAGMPWIWMGDGRLMPFSANTLRIAGRTRARTHARRQSSQHSIQPTRALNSLRCACSPPKGVCLEHKTVPLCTRLDKLDQTSLPPHLGLGRCCVHTHPCHPSLT